MSDVIFLHGASSSGKSTLAKSIRDMADRPLVHLSLDHFRDSGAIDPSAYDAWQAHRAAVFNGLHHSFASFANAGCDVILEHILDTPGGHEALQDLLHGHRVLFVGVMTPVSVLNAREAARGDRPKGSAAQDASHVHTGLSYDLTLKGDAPPQAGAMQVLSALETITPGASAFFRR